ncbi:hypothetical protein B0J14DRAFT_707010 [Halenospora varia]|nr:hypothetical protein B0J14DRAFT_707010 [Halenospora varia]
MKSPTRLLVASFVFGFILNTATLSDAYPFSASSSIPGVPIYIATTSLSGYEISQGSKDKPEESLVQHDRHLGTARDKQGSVALNLIPRVIVEPVINPVKGPGESAGGRDPTSGGGATLGGGSTSGSKGGTFGGGNGPTLGSPGSKEPVAVNPAPVENPKSAPGTAEGVPAPETRPVSIGDDEGDAIIVHPDSAAGPAAGPGGVIPSRFDDADAETNRGRGQTVLQSLVSAISSDSADTNVGFIEARGYARDLEDPATRPSIPLKSIGGGDKSQYLTILGIDGSKGDGWLNKLITNEGNEAEDAEILQYAVNVAQRTQIIKKAYNEDNDVFRQPATADPARVAKLKDMIVDNWRIEAVDTDTIKGLNFIVRDDIQTTASQASIDQAFLKAGSDRSRMATYQLETDNADEWAAYQEIAGNVHGAGIVRMLADSHQELGNLQVIAWHVFTKEPAKAGSVPGVDGATTQPGYYAIIAELGHPGKATGS